MTDCVTSGPNPVTITSGTFGGTLTATSNDCLLLLVGGNVTGKLTFRWKAEKGTQIVPTTTTATFASIGGGGLLDAGSQFGLHPELSLASSVVGGAFNGNGPAASVTLVVSEELGFFNDACSVGVAGVNLGLGTIRIF